MSRNRRSKQFKYLVTTLKNGPDKDKLITTTPAMVRLNFNEIWTRKKVKLILLWNTTYIKYFSTVLHGGESFSNLRGRGYQHSRENVTNDS